MRNTNKKHLVNTRRVVRSDRNRSITRVGSKRQHAQYKHTVTRRGPIIRASGAKPDVIARSSTVSSVSRARFIYTLVFRKTSVFILGTVMRCEVQPRHYGQTIISYERLPVDPRADDDRPTTDRAALGSYIVTSA